MKTDQLDGETDWKVRESVHFTQKYISKNGYESLVQSSLHVVADPPNKEIYDFKGTFFSTGSSFEPLRLKNTMWANTSVAAGEAIGIVVYTGKETRIQMNSREPRSKIGKTDEEINTLSVFLFCFVFFLASLLLIFSGTFFKDRWYIFMFRCILLLSSIIPISLRVNIDFAKIVYSAQISKDKRLDDTVVRNTSIPEELGRVEYLLTDKTGTLTQNHMIFKRLSTILANFDKDGMSTLKELVSEDIKRRPNIGKPVEALSPEKKDKRGKYDLIRELVAALVLCHNVTPTEDKGER